MWGSRLAPRCSSETLQDSPLRTPKDCLAIKGQKTTVFTQTYPFGWAMTASRRDLPPGKPRWGSAPLPQLSKSQRLPGGPCHLQGDLAPMPNNLCRYINDPSANGAGIGTKVHNPLADILLERLVEKECHKHRVIEGRILAEALEGKLLKSKVLQRPMHQHSSSFPSLPVNFSPFPFFPFPLTL